MDKIKDIIVRVKNFMDVFESRNGRIYSVYIAFFMVLSIFPFFISLVAIVSMIPFDINYDSIEIFKLFPKEAQGFIVGFIKSIKLASGPALILSSATSLWSSSRAFVAITDGLDRIENSKEKKVLFITRLLSSIKGFIFIIVLILIFAIPSILKLITVSLSAFDIKIPNIIGIFEDFRYLITLVLLFFAVVTMYMRLPTQKKKFKEIYLGSIFTTLGWLFFSYIFNTFMNASSNAVYGALSVFIALCIWFQFNATILLYGALINQRFHQKDKALIIHRIK